MKFVLALSAAVLLSTSAFATPYDSDPGTPAYSMSRSAIVAQNLADCCNGVRPTASTESAFLPNHSKVPAGKPYRGNFLDRSTSY